MGSILKRGKAMEENKRNEIELAFTSIAWHAIETAYYMGHRPTQDALVYRMNYLRSKMRGNQTLCMEYLNEEIAKFVISLHSAMEQESKDKHKG